VGADVGQDKWEEVDLITRGGNYGWSVREAFQSRSTRRRSRCRHARRSIRSWSTRTSPQLAPQGKFPKSPASASASPAAICTAERKSRPCAAVYVYADYQMGTIWGLRYDNGQITADGELLSGNSSRNISSFAEDRDGELYVLSFDGNIYEVGGAK